MSLEHIRMVVGIDEVRNQHQHQLLGRAYVPLHLSDNSTHSVRPCFSSDIQDRPTLTLTQHAPEVCPQGSIPHFLSYVLRDCPCPACKAVLAEAVQLHATPGICTPSLFMHGTRPTTTPRLAQASLRSPVPQVYVLSVPADEGDGWVFPTATHPLILDLANHVAPGKVDSRHVTCAPRLLCERLLSAHLF